MPPEPSSSSAKLKVEPKAKVPQSASEAALQECAAIEEELAALKVAFEHYFVGQERQPPMRAYEDLKKRLQKLKASNPRNTAVKFRVQSVNSKFLTYDRLWTRTLQEIENGTYKRDVLKARRRSKNSNEARPKQAAQDLTEELSDDDLEDLQPVRPVNEPRVPSRPEPASPPPAPAIAAVVPPMAPAVAAVVPPVAPAGPGTVPFRGMPTITPPLAPASAPARGMPTVSPAVPPMPPTGGTPPRGLPTISPPLPPVTPPPPPGAVARPPAPPLAPAARATPPPPPRPPAAATPPPPPGAAQRPQSGSASAALSDDKLRAVYDAYVTAKRRCQEDTSKMSYESVASTLRKQVPELLKQANATAVEFKVVIKDGKAVLKAVPK
ncbi:hypothetical protein P2318_01985 [Myxococcaceae bacterium GXIMD 01537]